MKKLFLRILSLALMAMLMVPCFASADTISIVVVDSQYGNGILRAEPNFDADIVEYIPNATIIEASSPYSVESNFENICDWFYVEVDGLSGWMHKSIVTEVDENDIIVLEMAANLRATPSADGEYLRGMDKGEMLIFIEEMDDDWSRVIWRGVTGYIHNSVYETEE